MPNKNAINDAELFELEWSVCTSGYEIKKANATPPPRGQVTREYLWNPKGKQFYDEIIPRCGNEKKYNPFLDCPGIAKEFSQIRWDYDTKKLNHDDVLKFANRYGLLDLHNDKNKSEKLDDWYEYVLLFSEVYYMSEHGHYESLPVLYNHLGLKPTFEISICKAPIKRHRFLEIRPKSLLGAMWVILAENVGKGHRLQSCENNKCKVWFNQKSNKRFCSDSCKVAWHRQSKN